MNHTTTISTATPAHTVSIPARRARAMAGTVAAKAKASKTPLLDRLAATKPVRAVKVPRQPSALEAALLTQIRIAGLPEPEAEYRFSRQRRWRFDFAYPALRVAIECEGGTWAGGRHTRGAGYTNDIEKYNEAALSGWAVIRATRDQIEDGTAFAWILRAVNMRAVPVTAAALHTR